MKGKQLRDATLRLEEAVIIYRNILGEHHVDVDDVGTVDFGFLRYHKEGIN